MSDSSSVSLSEPDPFACQIPLERVTTRCRAYCERAMSRAIQCQIHCRKYLLMRDAQTGDTYKGFASLVRYVLAPGGHTLRVTLLVPLVSRMVEQMRAWTFVSRDPPNAIHNNWATYSCQTPLDCALEGITFAPRDLPRYDSVPGYLADAFWSLWDPLGKHANQFGELNIFFHLGAPTDMQVGIPRGLRAKQTEHTPTAGVRLSWRFGSSLAAPSLPATISVAGGSNEATGEQASSALDTHTEAE